MHSIEIQNHELVTPAAPQWLSPNFENIPNYLTEQPWAVWKAEPRTGQTGKFNKAPRCPKSGIKIGANKPELFGSFLQAKEAYLSGNFTGVGVLLTGNGLVGVDIDGYQELFFHNPELKAWVKLTVDSGYYCEKSPSGTGLRLFIKGSLPSGGRKSSGLEIYDNARFLTVTGKVAKREGISHG